MAFVNEYISDEDRRKYDPEGRYLDTLDWTIDRENEVFIVNLSSGRQDIGDTIYYEFDVLYWNGYFIEYTKQNHRNNVINHDVIDIKNMKIPNEVADRKQEIFEIIREALLVNRGVGIYAAGSITDYKLDLNLIEDK